MIKTNQTGEQPVDQMVRIFKLLTHPARLAILQMLKDGEHCVCHLEAQLGFRQSYISQQLEVLRSAGLIQDRRDGWYIFYRVVNPKIYEVLDAVQELTGEPVQTQPRNAVNCSCPHCTA